MVEVNALFFKEDNFYNKDIYEKYEEDIKKYIFEYKNEDYYKIIENDKRTNIVNIFTNMRANIIKWYPFEKNTKVLEIGANYGEITEELVKIFDKVTAIEFTNTKKECILKRLENVRNLKLILCTNLLETVIEEKFDYITIIGTSEYAKKIGFKNLKHLIVWAKEHLNENGKIFMAIDNKFGVKYLAGSTRNNDEIPFANYKPYVNKDYKLYGKNELEEMLKTFNYKFYYPVPNYDIVHYLYTDEYLPNKGEYNLYYREDEEIMYNELSFIDEAIKDNNFTTFTNSYLVEISKEKENLDNTLFVKYTNMRKKEFKIITKIQKEKVTKKSYSNVSQEQIEYIKNNIEKLEELGFNKCERYEDNEIISNYISKPTFDKYLINLVKNEQIDEFYKEIYEWEKYLKDKLEVVEKEEKTIFDKYNIEIKNKGKLTILKDGFIDLIFPNVFYDGDGKYLVFDQEWYEENIPLEFILYRAIKQLFSKYKFLKEQINEKELYEKYGITNYIDAFDELENKWQDTIIDNDILKFYSEKWDRIISIEDIKFRFNKELAKLYEQIDLISSKNNELIIENEKLINENNEIKRQMQEIKNGRLYKFITKIRKKKYRQS